MKYRSIGEMPPPEQFRYAGVAEKGRPRHEKFDSFYIRHPFMDIGRRAKIFAPFDALTGFGDAVGAKQELYVERKLLSESEATELDRKLDILHRMIPTLQDARDKQIQAALTYYTPCTDENSEHFMIRGKYVTVSGTVTELDTVFGRVTVGGITVELEDVADIDILTDDVFLALTEN